MEIRAKREVFFEKIGRRADALVLLTHNGLGYAVWIEVAVEESEDSLKSKARSIRDYQELPEAFSQLFGVKVPYVDLIILRDGDLSLCEKLPPLD